MTGRKPEDNAYETAGIRGDVDTDVCYDKRIFAVEDEVPSAKPYEKPITIPISNPSTAMRRVLERPSNTFT